MSSDITIVSDMNDWHLLGHWLHCANQDDPSGLVQMLRRQLNKNLSTRISTLPCPPVVVGGRQGPMHSHSHLHRLDHTLDTLYHVQPKIELLFTIRAPWNDWLNEHAVVVWIPNNSSQCPFIRLSPHVSTRMPKLYMPKPYMPRSLSMWPAMRLRFNSNGSLVTNPSTVE